MTLARPTHAGIVTLQSGRPRSRFYEIAHRIAGRLEPEVAEAFLGAIEDLRGQIDFDDLVSAVRTLDVSAIEAALGTEMLGDKLADRTALRDAFARIFAATAEASVDVLTAHGMAVEFAAKNPLAIQFARQQTATLVTQITADQRLALQGIMGRSFQEGITPDETARLIHRVVGLRHDHATAPLNLAQEIRDGHAAAATSRRLDAATKAQIRARIKAGTVTDEFIDEVVEKYTHSLRRYRAQSIARTETIKTSNAATDESWRIGQRQGVIPETARRFVVVTPDDRLRLSHAEVPGMNPEGQPIGTPFETPFGAMMYPPWEPLCRCGTALVPNPSEGGII